MTAKYYLHKLTLLVTLLLLASVQSGYAAPFNNQNNTNQNQANQNKSKIKNKLTAAQKRTNHLDERTKTLKRDVIKLGRFLSDLAWVGSVRTSKSNSKTNTKSRNKNALSRDLLGLGQTLTKLEDGLLTPPGFQLIVYLSTDTRKNFRLNQVNFEIDGKIVHSRQYTDRENMALQQGGAHRLYITNLTNGKHTVTAYYQGGAKNKNQYQGKKSFSFNKKAQRKTIEFKLSSLIGKPSFNVKERN